MLRFNLKSSVTALNAGLCKAKGGIHPDRTIDDWVLLFVRQNQLGISIGDDLYDVKPDQVLFLPPRIPHAGTKTYPDGLTFYWLHFRVDNSDGPYELPLYTTLTRPHVMVELMRRFLDDQQSGRLNAMPLKGTLHLLQMLAEIAGNHVDTSALPDASIAMASQADEILRSRCTHAISTSTIAAELGCHPDHLGRIYRRVFDRTLTDSLNRYRIDRAALLLAESSSNVNEIAYKVGFQDKGYFRRVFRRYRGITPTEFRLLHTRVHLNT